MSKVKTGHPHGPTEPGYLNPLSDKWREQRTKQQGRGGAMRFNEDKPRLALNHINSTLEELEASIWMIGLDKYDLGNWLKGQSAMEASDSMFRHFNALMRGEDIDPESGEHHGGHLICSVKIFVNALLVANGEYDDRPIKPAIETPPLPEHLVAEHLIAEQWVKQAAKTKDVFNQAAERIAKERTEDGC